MIPHNMTLFKFMCTVSSSLPNTSYYKCIKIDRDQIQFREYVFTGTEPLDSKPNVFPTELGGLICRVGFKLLL